MRKSQAESFLSDPPSPVFVVVQGRGVFFLELVCDTSHMAREHRKTAALMAFKELNRQDQIDHAMGVFKHLWPMSDAEQEVCAKEAEAHIRASAPPEQ